MNLEGPRAVGIRQEPIARRGDNCWRTEISPSSAFLVDGEAYYGALARTLPLARERIWIIGWDFNPWIELTPGSGGPNLGSFLRGLVEECDTLEIRMLIWAFGPLYSGKSLKIFSEHEWADHPRIFLRFDRGRPLRASHHQKIVCVDDVTAFVGGMDLTLARWDSCEHLPHNPLRKKPTGEEYGPVHDVQALVTGAAAGAISEIAAKRWRQATEESVDAGKIEKPVLWPPTLKPDLSDCRVAIAQTRPAGLRWRGRHEAAALTFDALAAARRHLYIETQYLASFKVADRLARLLRKPDGPEILIILTKSSRGIVEHFVMAHNRNRLLRRLKRADVHDRLRVMYPTTESADGSTKEILVHSKLIIVDDAFLRIGSSNLNNRSEGLDTECDVAFEAADDQQHAAVAGLRNRLLAEHVGSDADTVAREIARTGSMLAAVDKLNVGARRLNSLDVDPQNGMTTPLPGTQLLDPPAPMQPLRALRRWWRACISWISGWKR